MVERRNRDITASIEHISAVLRECALTNTADIQNNDFTQAENDLEAHINQIQKLGDRIIFTAGEEIVPTLGVVKTFYKTRTDPRNVDPLKPGKSIYLMQSVREDGETPRLYVGNRSLLIATSGLATALTQSATLEFQARRTTWQTS